MARRRERFCCLAAAALCLVACVVAFTTGALADEPEAPPSGLIVFARNGALWTVPAAGGEEPTRVADLGLPADEAIGAIRVSPAGGLVVIESDTGLRWVQLEPGQTRRAARAPCAGPARLAPDGSAFLCAGDEGTVFQPVAWRRRSLAIDSSLAAPLGSGELAFCDGRKIWRAPADRLSRRSLVADHAPIAHLLASPVGDRAVGFYSEPDRGEHVYTFRIDDGRAVRRTLAGPAMPISWSADGQWVLIRDTRRRACVIRSVGGERLCWNGFTGLDVSPDGTHVLLTRPSRDDRQDGRSLFVAPILGVSAKRPQRLVEDVWGAAGWYIPE